jgi:predicted Zn-dependent protease with MMP-like domain
MPTYTTPPTDADIAALAEQALARIPAKLLRHLANVTIAVEDLADDETLDGLGIDSAWDLTGLYRGIPLHRRGSGDVAPQPDMIVLYRHAILLEWVETDVDLASLVANVMIHEAAHHFGFSDEEIAALEREETRD